MRLSVLDQSVAVVDRPQSEAIRNTMALAKACEGWGYHRFWVSEHHANPTIVGTAPEILIAAIAATTSTIRVGSAGVMLPHYSAFKVAEQFRVLDAIAPGRIDLGLGRAPGSDGRTAFALNPLANERPAQFPNDVRDLMAWVTGSELPEGHHFRTVKAYPEGDTAPEIWMLGSSDYGAQVAAHFGLPYAFAWFFTEGVGAQQALDLYRRTTSRARATPCRTRRCAYGRSPPTPRRRRSTTSRRAPASACCATAASSRRSCRPRRPPRMPTRRWKRPASPSCAGKRSSAPASRSPPASPSSQSAWTYRRWPSSPGPTTRPRATPATASSPTRWASCFDRRHATGEAFATHSLPLDGEGLGVG